MCESFWVNDLALSIPFTAPAASYLKSLAISAIRIGKSLYECKKFLYITMWCGQFIGLKTYASLSISIAGNISSL